VPGQLQYFLSMHSTLFSRSFAISLCATQGHSRDQRAEEIFASFLLLRSLLQLFYETTKFDFFLILNSALIGTQKLGSFTLLCLNRLVEQAKMVSIST
jgi:hypothetical protein